jgi:hypothetical protein
MAPYYVKALSGGQWEFGTVIVNEADRRKDYLAAKGYSGTYEDAMRQAKMLGDTLATETTD